MSMPPCTGDCGKGVRSAAIGAPLLNHEARIEVRGGPEEDRRPSCRCTFGADAKGG